MQTEQFAVQYNLTRGHWTVYGLLSGRVMPHAYKTKAAAQAAAAAFDKNTAGAVIARSRKCS